MEGLTRLIGSIDLVRQSYNPNLEIEGIALTMFDSRISLSRQVADQVRAHFTHKVYKAVIPAMSHLRKHPVTVVPESCTTWHPQDHSPTYH